MVNVVDICSKVLSRKAVVKDRYKNWGQEQEDNLCIAGKCLGKTTDKLT